MQTFSLPFSRWLSLARFVICASSALSAPVAYAQAPATCLSAHEEAQRLRRDGHFVQAQAQLLRCAQTSCPRVVRNDCTSWAGEVQASTPSLVFAVSSSRGGDLSEVRVFANGTLLRDGLDGRALDVDPGVYALRFEAPGHAPAAQTITVREAEKNRLVRVQLQEAVVRVSAPAPQHVWPTAAIVLGGVAVAAGGTALGFGLWGKNEYDALEAGCGRSRSCTDGQTESGRRAYVIADVAAGVAAGSLVGALVAYLIGNRPRAAQVDARWDRGGMRLSLRKSF